MQSKLILSALCVALLSACNSDGPSLLDKDGSRPGFLGTDNSKKPVPPVDNDNSVSPVNKLFSESVEGIGQQTGPIVVAQDRNANGLIDHSDEVLFNQPGIVSTFCNADGNSKGCEPYRKIFDRSNTLVAEVTKAKDNLIKSQEDLADAKAKEAAAQQALNNPSATAVSKIQAQIDLEKAQQEVQDKQLEVTKNEAALKTAAENFNQSGSPLLAPETGIIMLDVNNNYHTVTLSSTIDEKTIPNNGRQPDAGITKIDRERIRHADGTHSERPYNQSTDAKFNEVIVFARDRSTLNTDGTANTNVYLDSYFRAPAMAGWSYQTFGNFHNNNLHGLRGVNVGYQSVGLPTDVKGMTELESNYGPAVYTGIAHAYYNNNQVTMKNKVVANFAKRELSYETTEAALYHTFEGRGGEGTQGETHVVEKRPDLNLTGKASWSKASSEFTGKIRAANGLEGKFEGRFYGPQAEEVGGVFGLQGEQGNQAVQYVGGFGGTRGQLSK